MSIIPTITTTYTRTATLYSLANTFSERPPKDTTVTRTYTTYPTDHVSVRLTTIVYTWMQVPLTCIGESHSHDEFEGTKPNPDISGIGILLAFFVTDFSVVLLTLAAYIGGFLPAHLLRRVDRRVFHANSRREHSRWRTIIESVMMSLSDQQLVTGLAILVAGYYEMMNGDLTLHHWRIVTYLAWLSSSVHIASLTLLRDVLNKNPTIRNMRVAGMLTLLTLLTIALWPTRFITGTSYVVSDMSSIPARCFWTSTKAPFTGTYLLDPNWVITMVMLLFAYVWKLSQLFASSRGLVRRWLVAKPEAAMERLMRRVVLSRRSKWLRWPAYKLLTICYIIFVAWAEFAESFVASIMYLCLTLPYGVMAIIGIRRSAEDDVIAGERRLTFGQLVPLFLLVIPVLLVFELSTSSDTKNDRPEALYSLMASELHRPREDTHIDLISALRLNEPSNSNNKLQNDSAGSYDPIVDHLMRSRAFKSVIWAFFVGLLTIGFTTVLLMLLAQGPDIRVIILMYGGGPALVACVPLMVFLVLPCSRRLR